MKMDAASGMCRQGKVSGYGDTFRGFWYSW
jgi:hypothetical protein